MKTINLLPPARQEELRYAQLLYSFEKFFAVTMVSFALVLLFQLGIKVFLQDQSSSLTQQIESVRQQVNKQENSKIKQQITDINNVISDYSTLAAAIPKWSNVVKAFAPLPPPGVIIMTFSADLTKKEITITGFSPDRDSVIEFRDRILADSDHFYNVDYPLENIAKATNINFHYTFSIKDSLLQ